MSQNTKESLQLQKIHLFLKKTWKFIRKEYIKIIIILVIVVSIAFAIYSHNKKQTALYDQYVDQAMQIVYNKNIPDSMPLFDKAIKMYPNKPKAYAGRAFAYYLNDQDAEALVGFDRAISLTGEVNPAFMYKLKGDIFKEQDKMDSAVEAYGKAYDLSPSDRDVVDGYVSGLITQKQYEKAYPIIEKYITDTPKDNYWDDADVWNDKGMAALMTHRCIEAGTSAWHAMMRSKEGEDTYKIAEAIMGVAFNSKECIDTEDKKGVSNEVMKEAVATNEAQNMK